MMTHISARNVCIDFPIYSSSGRSMKNAVLRATTGGKIGKDSGNHTYIRSLDGVCFEIGQGERVGLIGHNGSGKTTLLRALSGVYAPTGGTLIVSGRVVSLLDITLGMDPDATGYENIMMRGIVMGMSPRKMKSLTDEIAEFTDLGEYLNMPLRSYSSGMQMRLSFAVSTCVDADVLLMDEWLSVGDTNFQEKAAIRLSNLIEKTPILIIASHSDDLVNKVCTRSIQLEHGKVAADNPVVKRDKPNDPGTAVR
jgi:lipopolysaccharide transport system ATP-binding protein